MGSYFGLNGNTILAVSDPFVTFSIRAKVTLAVFTEVGFRKSG
jgi:hypothetical protein